MKPAVRAAAVLLVTAAVPGCGARSGPPPAQPEAPAPVSAPEAGSAPAGRGEKGRASYYSDKLAGRRTASGERYDPRALTAAHRTLPFGAVVDVIRRDGRRVRVRINDRGPFTRGRVIDLSRTAAEAIGLIRDGVADVTLVLVSKPDKAGR